MHTDRLLSLESAMARVLITVSAKRALEANIQTSASSQRLALCEDCTSLSELL